MATKNNPVLPKVDVNKFIQTPEFRSQVAMLNKDPIGSYKLLTTWEETQSGPMAKLDGGLQLIKELKNNLNVTPQDIEKAYDISGTAPSALLDAINKDPEKAYKEAYNTYYYGDGSAAAKMQFRSLLQYSHKALTDKGIDPEQVINQNGFSKALDTLGNVVGLGSNSLAKGFAALYGKSPDVKIWGGNGWIDTLRAVDANPTAMAILEKKKKMIPLTPEEQKTDKEFSTKYGGWGTLLNIVADPMIIAGLAGKGVEAAGIGLKSVGLLKGAQVLKAVEAPFATVKELSAVNDLTKGGKLGSILHDNIETAKAMLGNKIDSGLLKNVDKVLNTVPEKVDIKSSIGLLESLGKDAKAKGLISESNEIMKVNTKLKNSLFKMDTVQKSPMIQSAIEKNTKFKNMLTHASEKIGFRRLISNVPKEEKIINGKSVSPKIVEDNVRRLGLGMTQKTIKLSNDVLDHIQKNIKPLFKDNKQIQDILKANPRMTEKDIINQIAERPQSAKMYGIDEKLAEPVNKLFDDYIIEEAKHIGSKAVPKIADTKVQEWKTLADSYHKAIEKNPSNVEIPGIEDKLRGILRDNSKNGSALNLFDDGTVKNLSDNINYMTSLMTPEAKKIYLTFNSKNKGNFNNQFKSYITNPSFKHRVFQGTTLEKNKYIVDDIGGGQTQWAKDILTNSAKEKDPKKAKELIQFADNINKMGALLRDQGKNFFENDLGKIMSIRGARTVKTIQQAEFYKGMKQFGEAGKIGNNAPVIDGIKYEHPKEPIAGLSNMFFHPDIAKAIDKMWSVTHDDGVMKKWENLYLSFQNFWKSTTLNSLFLSTTIRNFFGNWLNSMLVIKRPETFVKSWVDAMSAIKGKNYRFITNNGMHTSISKVFDEAIKNGIPGTTYRKIDVEQSLKEAESIGAGVINSITKGVNKISGTINKSPLAKANDIVESWSKLALYFQLVKEGHSYDDAAKLTYKALFDYSDVSEFQKGIRNVIPFFTWTKNNLPLQITNLLTTPSRSIIKIQKGLNTPEDTNDTRFQGDYLKNSPTIPLPGSSKGQPQYLILESIVPLFDISQIIRGMTGGTKMIVDDIVKSISPLIKTPIELATNRSFAMHADIEKTPVATVNYLGVEMSPKTKAILQNFRLVNVANKGINLKNDGLQTGPVKDISTMIFSWGLGTPIAYDISFSKNIATSTYKKQLDAEINQFYGYMRKNYQVLMNGQKMSKEDLLNIRNKLGKISVFMADGFYDAKINKKEMGTYALRLVNAFKGGL